MILISVFFLEMSSQPAMADPIGIEAGAEAILSEAAEDIAKLKPGDTEAENSQVISVKDIPGSVSEEATDKIVIVKINSPNDLVNISKESTIDSYSKNKCFVLMKDLDMTGYQFTTIPLFSGAFDGRDHYITGLTYGGNGYVTGLFRYVDEGAIIQNLNVKGNITAVEKEEVTGGICGVNHGIISNCTFEGSVTGETTTGGIAGINEAEGSIKGCTNHGIITGYYYTGGIAGKNYGDIAYSYNKGNINNTEDWVNGSDAITPGSSLVEAMMLGDISAAAAQSNVEGQAGLDTGGIAGFSRGGIYQCKNTGSVGYEHAGYNVGGIAGRQSGIISFCTNSGKICGRKDVGGIVGQMEPYLSLSEMETLPDAVDRLHDLVDVALDDMDGSVSSIGGDVEMLSQYADNAVTAGNDLGVSAENYLNTTVDTVNNAMDKVDYISDKMPGVVNDIRDAGKDLSKMSDSIGSLFKDLDVYKKVTVSGNDKQKIEAALSSISANNVKLAEELKKIADSTSNASGTDIEKSLKEIEEAVKKLSDTGELTGDMIVSVNEISNVLKPYIRESLSSVSGNSKELTDNMSNAVKNLRSSMESTRDIFDHVNGMPKQRMTHVGADFDLARESLKTNLSGMSDMLSAISGHSTDSSHLVNDDLSKVNDQINVVFHLISDEMERLSDMEQSEDDLITDISEAEMDNVTEGRVDHSDNQEKISGDINVGGIVGSMSIDKDDPEENAAGDMNGGFTARYLLRNAVIQCNNNADIESKKDGAGGIAGYMAHGIVSDCESYGAVRSSEGGYVGGIAGQSLSVVRDSYAMNFLDGKTYVGGVTGFGTTINGCTSFPSFEEEGDRYGAVAGQIDIDRETQVQHLEAISGNRFVSSEMAGIDNKSIIGKAEPVSYDSLIKDADTPPEFKKLRVLFMVDDVVVQEKTMAYGTDLSDMEYPDIPPYDGKYVKWKYLEKGLKLTRPIIVKGEAVDVEKTLLSEELYPETNSPAGLVSGNFIDGDRLSVKTEVKDMSVKYTVAYETSHSGKIMSLRLYDPFEKSVIYGVSGDGTEKELEGEKKGSYMEIKGDMTYDTYIIRNEGLIDKIRNFLPKT